MAKDVSLVNVTKKDHSKLNAIRLVFKISFCLFLSVFRSFPFRPGGEELSICCSKDVHSFWVSFLPLFQIQLSKEGYFPTGGSHKGSLVRGNHFFIVLQF